MITDLLAISEVRSFLASSPRHKLLIAKDYKAVPGEAIDLSLTLAKWIRSYGTRDKNFPYYCQIEINNCMNAVTVMTDDAETIIPVTNIGILFEPAIVFSPEAFLKRYSKNDILVLFWSGTIKGNRLYLPDVNSNCTIDLTEINHLVI